MLLDPGEVHVWHERIATVPAVEILSDDECERASRYRFERDRIRFIAARTMLRRVVGRCLGAMPERVSFTYSSFGKPAAAGYPSLQFNLSHSGDFALCAVSVSRRVGIDIEAIRPVEDIESLFRTIASRAEQAEFHALEPERRPSAFYRAWTMKEACVKALGTGLSTPVERIDVLSSGGECVIELPGFRCLVMALGPQEGYASALAIEQLFGDDRPKVIFHDEISTDE